MPDGRSAALRRDQLARVAEAGWGTEAFVRQMYPNAPMHDVVRLLRWCSDRRVPGTAVGFIRLLHEYDVREVLPTLRLPVLVLATEGLSGNGIVEQAGRSLT